MRWKKQAAREKTLWKPWFAWHPVVIEDTGEVVWFEWIWRAFDFMSNKRYRSDVHWAGANRSYLTSDGDPESALTLGNRS